MTLQKCVTAVLTLTCLTCTRHGYWLGVSGVIVTILWQTLSVSTLSWSVFTLLLLLNHPLNSVASLSICVLLNIRRQTQCVPFVHSPGSGPGRWCPGDLCGCCRWAWGGTDPCGWTSSCRRSRTLQSPTSPGCRLYLPPTNRHKD